VRGGARGYKKPIGGLNKLELRYQDHLRLLLSAGEISRYEFEPVKLRLAKATYYTPDFRVLTPEGLIQYHEVKGFWRDDARVKIKVAAEVHDCYKFCAVVWRLKEKEWCYEWFGHRD